MATVTSKAGLGTVRIYINEMPHLILPRESFRGLQSWLFGRHSEYVIEISLSGAEPMRLEYDKIEIWADVLKALDEAFY